ncbi:MAG: sulfotransferase [Candidatus Dojkabacteria bacterium]
MSDELKNKKSSSERTVAFIGGLHRSGTTLLANLLGAHSDVSAFVDTGAPKDEGQHLQTVFPTVNKYGGSGRFAFDKRAHLTESSELVTDENKLKLWKQWSKHWDLGKKILLEKSPPNLMMTRFLQEMIPGAVFIILFRHPVITSLATQKWSKTSLDELMQHWLKAFEVYGEDKKHLRKLHEVYYEDLIREPEATISKLYLHLGLEIERLPEIKIRTMKNTKYEKMWRELEKSDPNLITTLTDKYESRINRFGYTMIPDKSDEFRYLKLF